MDRLLEFRRNKKKRYYLLEEAKEAKEAAKVAKIVASNADDRPFQLEKSTMESVIVKIDTSAQFTCLPSFSATKPL